MTQTNIRRRRPPITIGDIDHEKLTRLAASAPPSLADAAEELLAELDRAILKPERAVPAAVVRMGSTVTYRPTDGASRTVQLVYPAEADIAQGRISVLTPIGAALIGLAEGRSIGWHDRSGRLHELTVESVKQAEAAPQPATAEA